MRLNNIIKEYHRKLLSLYPPQEIQSIIGLVMETYLKISKVEISLKRHDEVHEALQSVLMDILKELETGKPVQYIIGDTSFYDMNISVNPDVLIPRQETEELVQWIVTDARHVSEKFRILDIGTGSGCIAIALANELKDARISACDIFRKALDLAKENAKRNDVQVNFFKMNVLKQNLLPDQFDIIVSNPPYIPNSEKMRMHRNVLEHEPISALFVPDKEPLLFYEAIAGFSLNHLSQNGTLYLEIHEKYGKEVVHLLKKASFSNIQLKKDINGKDRMVKAVWSYERE
jgi:release factor glutamine methyltransferase